MAEFIGHYPCEKCGSSNNLAKYSDGSWFCFSYCGNKSLSEDYKEEHNIKDKKAKKPKQFTPEQKEFMKDNITEEEQWDIKEKTQKESYGYRSISDEVTNFYGCRTEVGPNGEVLARYYPVTTNDKLTGYKVRNHPKTFHSIANVSNQSDLYGAFRFRAGGKYVLVVEGECLLPETKVFTKNGWVSLAEYTDGEVMQGDGTFAYPIAKVVKDYKGKLIKYQSGSYNLTMTPEHNMIRLKNNQPFKCKAQDLKKKHYPVPRTVNYKSKEEDLWTKLQVMISADFTLRKEGDLMANFVKERKILRCRELLKLANLRFSENIQPSTGKTCFFIHRNQGLTFTKLFDYKRDLSSAKTIINEVVHWDGNHVKDRNSIEYSSNIYHNAKFIQTCAHLCGYTSTIRKRKNKIGEWYAVSILFGKQTSSTQKGYSEIEYNGKVMCLTMPNGSLLVSEKDSISVTGNCDAHAGYQMFKEYSDYKKSDFVTAVVSITTGAANASKQIANNYEFLNNFEQIIIGFDNDEVGIAGMEKIMQALPKGKVKICTWTKAKDPNEYLQKGLQKQFLADFYNAKTYVPAGVVGSSELYAKLLEGAVVERIPLPPFMNKLAGMLGNIELGTIGIFAAGSGAAKTTVANELLYFWIFNSPHKVGVVSLELTCAQYGQAMLSRHIGNKISRMTDTTEKLKFLNQENIKQKAQELFLDSEGVDRWMMIDERDGSLEVLQEKIEQLIIACGCKLIILDPLSDLMDGLSIDEQAVFMKWCKSMIKNYNVTFLMIAHIRKSGNNKDAASTGAFIPEEAITGSSTIFKSASWVVMMQRDKYNADEIVKNTTKLTLSKNRSGGETGDAGELYYDNQTHTLHDKNEYMGSNF